MSAKSSEIGRVRFTSYRQAVSQAVSMSVAPYGYTLTVGPQGLYSRMHVGFRARSMHSCSCSGRSAASRSSGSCPSARVWVEVPEPSLWAFIP